jgi:hypothetical protein
MTQAGRSVWCRAYGARSSSGSISQPFRAGLTFGGRPSGPCIQGDFCRVVSPSTWGRQVEMLGMTKWRADALIRSRRTGWAEKPQVPPLRFAPVLKEFARINKVTDSPNEKKVGMAS